MRRVFLDVGANFGQSIEVALDQRYGFDAVYAFEPAEPCQRILDRFRDKRLHIEPFGLGAGDGTAQLYDPGSLGASVYHAADSSDGPLETIAIRDVAEWLAENIRGGDEVYTKLNCEGSEADIVERLYATGQLPLLGHVLLSLDIQMFPEQAARGARVLALLAEAGIDLTRREDIGYELRTWLRPLAETDRSIRARWGYWSGRHLRPDRRVRRIARNLVGGSVYNAAAAAVGPSRRGLMHRATSGAKRP